MSVQPSLLEPPASPQRILTLAGILAGFRWPGRGSFDKLTKPQKAACLEAAELALTRLRNEGSE